MCTLCFSLLECEVAYHFDQLTFNVVALFYKVVGGRQGAIDDFPKI